MRNGGSANPVPVMMFSRQVRIVFVSALIASASLVLTAAPGQQPQATVWKIDRTDSVGGQRVETIGAPRVVETAHGRAVAFAGDPDGLLLSGPSPISGAGEYTVEALVFITAGGSEKQKVIHIQDETGTRVIIELSQYPGGLWAYETGTKAYLDGKPVETYLSIKGRRYPTERWYWLAVSWDGKQMNSYINGEKFLTKPVNTLPLCDACVTGIGVRASKRDSFSGQIREIRLTRAALAPDRLQHLP
jgi:hypothetical protein